MNKCVFVRMAIASGLMSFGMMGVVCYQDGGPPAQTCNLIGPPSIPAGYCICSIIDDPVPYAWIANDGLQGVGSWSTRCGYLLGNTSPTGCQCGVVQTTSVKWHDGGTVALGAECGDPR